MAAGLTVLSGMRSGVAVTTTQLGLTLGDTLTALDVDRAFDLLHESLTKNRLS